MGYPYMKAVLALTAVAVLVAATTGCKPGDDQKQSIVSRVAALKKEEPPKLPTGAQGLVDREFLGMGVEVNASSADGAGSGADGTGPMVLNDAEVRATGLDGKVTVIRSATARIDPEGKKVVFEGGVVAEGPHDNKLMGGHMVWYYELGELEAVDGFTLANGHGITNGDRCRTDIGFRHVQVE